MHGKNPGYAIHGYLQNVGRPAVTARGAVAAGHPATAAAAREILAEGGNAFDAVLAAVCAACAAEPVLCSLGGGGYLLARRAGEDPVLYDFFVDTPRTRRPLGDIEFYPIHADFGAAVQEFHIGHGAMATPGLVRGLFAAHRDLASLPMTRLIEPALGFARAGVALRAVDAYLLQVVGPILTARPESRAVYCHPDGRLLAEGEVLSLPDLADTLEALAREGEALFYQGEIAQDLLAECAAKGGHLTARDLKDYRVEVRKPLACRYRDARVFLNPPPSSGGILIAFALQLLAARAPAIGTLAEAERLERLAQVMALTNRARLEGGLREALADPARDPAAEMLDPALLDRYAREIAGRPAALRGTTHISVVDAQGNVAALSISNGEGCGHMVPGTGIMMNNMLGEEDLNPGGFHTWQEGRRMTSMMCPSLVERAGGPVLVLGSGGSNRIRTAILQVLINVLDRDMPLGAAISDPRLHVEGGTASLEEGTGAQAAPVLAESCGTIARWPRHNLFFGGVHAVARNADGGVEAAGDPRRGGSTGFA